jgi:hypothetical protein
VSYPPLFIWSLGIPWKLFSQASALQLLMSSYALTGVVAIVYLGWVYHSRLAGLAAGALLSFSPIYFYHSMTVMGEVPSIGVAIVAIAFAEKYRRAGGRSWLVLAGITLAVSLSLKILPFYAGPFIGLLIITRYIKTGSWKDFWEYLQATKWLLLRDLAILGSVFLLTFFLPVFFFDLSSWYEQVIGMRLVSREAQVNVVKSNNKPIIDFIFGNAGLAALALYGLVFVVAPKVKKYWLLLVWFIFIWISMYIQVPLRGKHLPIFLPVLALFSGFAVDQIFKTLLQVRQQRASLQSFAMSLTSLVVLVILSWDAASLAAGGGSTALAADEEEEQVIDDREAMAFIHKVAGPTDCVIADNPVFLYHTHHLPPPELAEVSLTRIATGYLTLQDIIQAIQSHPCHVVAVLTPRFAEEIPGLPEWLAKNYLGLYQHDEISIHFAKKGADDNYMSLPGHSFGNQVNLYGVRFGEPAWEREEAAFISLFWQLEGRLEQQYIEKITLRDATTGEQQFQMTRLPFEGQFNPASWQTGERVKDTFWLTWPADLAAGSYHVFLSVCLPETEQCLAVDNNQGQIELDLGRIKVVK